MRQGIQVSGVKPTCLRDSLRLFPSPQPSLWHRLRMHIRLSKEAHAPMHISSVTFMNEIKWQSFTRWKKVLKEINTINLRTFQCFHILSVLDINSLQNIHCSASHGASLWEQSRHPTLKKLVMVTHKKREQRQEGFGHLLKLRNVEKIILTSILKSWFYLLFAYFKMLK